MTNASDAGTGLHKVPPPLPGRGELWELKVKSQLTLNDRVMVIHNILREDEKLSPRYHLLLNAVYDDQAIEGTLAYDNAMAAQMIRDYAVKKDPEDPLGKEKLSTISKALAVVMRRYGYSRKERRDMLGGEIVPNTTGE
jgi:hypothetical protein